MTDYKSIANKFGRVRRVWKRTAALSGLAVVILEGIGLLTTAILVDLLFMPGLLGRIIILLALIATFIYLLYKNALKPMTRNIDDRQIALYIEEHYPEFQGALIAAAEFGPQDDLPPEQKEIINTILKEAESRAQKFDLGKAVDFSRLKKYGILAVGLFVVYIILPAAFPDTAGTRIERVLSPWTAEKKANADKGADAKAKRIPIRFSLDKEDTNLLRGTPFDLQVQLNRAPDSKVNLHFRPKLEEGTQDQGVWNVMEMSEADVLHGYSTSLPDVNEAMEFFVSAEGYESPKHKIDVYDPLVVDNLIVVTKYPDYLKKEDKTENSPTGEVYAVAGSTITVKIVTNRPLEKGSITIGENDALPVTVSSEDKDTALVSFKVDESSSYTYRVEDSFGQVAESASPARIEVIKDAKPKIDLVRPTDAVAATPLGEVRIEADAADDFGIESVQLVYRRGADINAEKHYVPVTLQESKDGPRGSKRAVLTWEMEKIEPVLEPQEVLTWYLEVKDRKGQAGETEIAFLPITHFETWLVEGETISENGVAGMMPPAIESILKEAWLTRLEKDMLPPKQFDKRVKDVADIMLKPKPDGTKTNQVWEFLTVEKFPDDPEFVKKINSMCKDAHGLLDKRKLNEGIDVLRAAVAELIAKGLLENVVMPDMEMTQNNSQAATSEFKANMEQIQQLESKMPPTDADAAKQTAKDIKAAEKAKEAEKKTSDLEKKQAELVNKAKELAKKAEGQKGKKDDAKAKDAQKKLAEQQKDVADKAKKAAREIKKEVDADSKAGKAAKKLEAAAQKMEEAAKAMKQNDMAKGARKAEEARKDLADIKDEIMGLSQEKLTKMLEELERKTEKAMRKQDQIQKGTQAVAKDTKTSKGKKPNAKQERDLNALTKKQAEMKNDIDDIKKTLEEIDKMSKEGKLKRETAQHVSKAKKDLRRSRLDKKITNASVELARKQADTAAEEQKMAKEALKKVLESVRSASDSLASDYESELRRAKNEAARVKKALEKLNPKAAKKAQAKAKDDKAPKKDTAKKDKQDEKPLTPQEREEKAEETAVTIGVLKRHLKRRNFVDKEIQKKLEKSTGTPVDIAKALKGDTEEAVKLQEVMARISNKLEEEYEIHLASKRLFTAQREDCPPQYRNMVNKYFEKLSSRKK